MMVVVGMVLLVVAAVVMVVINDGSIAYGGYGGSGYNCGGTASDGVGSSSGSGGGGPFNSFFHLAESLWSGLYRLRHKRTTTPPVLLHLALLHLTLLPPAYLLSS